MIDKNFIPQKKGGEEIIFHLRRHWSIFARIFIAAAILALIPPAGYYFLGQKLGWGINETARALGLVLGSGYYLFLLVFTLTLWTNTYLDIWTVSTHRIINREQNTLFSRVVSELNLKRIQDVSVEQTGILATLLHYGDIYIQTAGTKTRFIFKEVPRPYRTAKIIQKLNERSKKNFNGHS